VSLAIRALLVAIAVPATLAAGTSSGARGASAGRSERPAPVVPLVDARRIAAQCRGAWSYMPAWLPPGFVFARWSVASHNVACDEGPVVRFRRGVVELTWRAFDPRLDPLLRCRARRFAARVLNGRAVFYLRTRRVEAAWTCAGGFFPKISVSQRTGGNGRATAVELERMVASAHTLPPGRARGSGYELMPPRQVGRIATAYAGPLYLPTWLPPGFIFSHWNVVPHDRDTDGRRSLFVTFGRDGPVLQWGVYAGADTLGLDCPGKHSYFRQPNHPTAIIAGRRIFLRVGIHGGSTWTCVRANAVGNAKPLEIQLWYDIRLDSPAFRRKVMRMVATARLVPTARAAATATASLPTRSCGFESFGKGWYLRATRSVSCREARTVFRAFFSTRLCSGRCLVRGYRCRPDYNDDVERVRCTTTRRLIVFRSLP
jgi:hypothetical protein